MRSRSFTGNVFAMPLLLATTFFLAACSQTLTTQTVATDKIIAADVCRAWPRTTYSSRDTEQSQREAQANNAARSAYCGEGAK